MLGADQGSQPPLLEAGPSLHEVDFVVVDLETTGGSPHADRITEIGAVRVRGGQIQGEFATLVNPGRGIPPTITVLTGITDAMVIAAPEEDDVIPRFLDFARGAVLVAHNARFDVGFLKQAAERLGMAWPRPRVVDTVALARRVVSKDEAPNHKLASLARLFHADVTPDHRALTDARATVDVLHGLLARLAPLGITELDDLATAADPVPQAIRRKRTLADDLPTTPGVYQFLDSSGRILYVGTATNLRSRVRSYFTAAEKRRRIAEMVRIAHRVSTIPAPTPLEASVRELRLIAAHTPPYNRKSRTPSKEPWIRLTDESYPRASIVRTVPLEGADGVLGPFRTRAAATAALEAISGTFALRSCTRRLPVVPSAGSTACAQAELGRCSAPCVKADPELHYAGAVAEFLDFCRGDSTLLLSRTGARLQHLIASQRYEEAAVERDRVQALLRGAARAQRLAALQGAAIIAAAPGGNRGVWEVIAMSCGRLLGSALALTTDSVPQVAQALAASSEAVQSPTQWAGAASAEESELVWKWLERPGVRILESSGTPLALPRLGAARALALLPELLGLPSWIAPSTDPEQQPVVAA